MQLKSNFKKLFGKSKLPNLGKGINNPKTKKLKLTKPKLNSIFTKKRKSKAY